MRTIEEIFGDLRKIDLTYVNKEDNSVYLVLFCKGEFDGSRDYQKALIDKMDCYLKHIRSEWFRTEYPGLPAKVVISFDTNPHPLILEMLSNCIKWFNEHEVELLFQLNDRYFRIRREEEQVNK